MKVKENKLYIAKTDKDSGVFKGVKEIGDYTPKGYKISNTYFVDNSGFGSDSEIALTASQFLDKIKKGKSYAITSTGQFQVYITEYVKIKDELLENFTALAIIEAINCLGIESLLGVSEVNEAELPDFLDLLGACERKEIEYTIRKNRKNKVIQYLLSCKVLPRHCSPNLVNLYANNIGIRLTSQEVIDISDNYK